MRSLQFLLPEEERLDAGSFRQEVLGSHVGRQRLYADQEPELVSSSHQARGLGLHRAGLHSSAGGCKLMFKHLKG